MLINTLGNIDSINGIAINNCPICNGTGDPRPEDKIKGILKCMCTLHAHVCPTVINFNLYYLNKIRKEEIHLGKTCDCIDYINNKII